ncbi:hypothetical protein TNCV_4657871 [Trichonephila clavipes]|nr:hypothetical protein TNCV_4657871 [Trichonephila clavipes]
MDTPNSVIISAANLTVENEMYGHEEHECHLKIHHCHPSGIATLTTVLQRLGSNPGESMAVCKRIVPSQHGGTLNSHRAANPLVRLVKRREAGEP